MNTVIQGFFSDVNKSNFETAKAQYLSTVLINALNTPNGGHKTIQGSFQSVLGQIKNVDVQGVDVVGETASATAFLTAPWGSKWHCKMDLIKEGGREWKINDWNDPEMVGQEHLRNAMQNCQFRNKKAAAIEFQAALTENPKDALIPMAWGICDLGSADLADAEKRYNDALHLCGDFCSDVYLVLGGIYEKQGKPADAERSFRKAIDSNSITATTSGKANQAKAGAYSALAKLYLDGSKFDQAINTAQRALELSPADAGTLDTLGWAYYKKGDRAQALNYLARAEQNAPNAQEIKQHYAEASKGN